MADNLQKRPSKGILKNSSSFDKPEVHSNAKKSKETKWDEMNIIATLHPPDKDYGHMKIEEPKTPYSYSDDPTKDELDAALLAEKIKSGALKPAKVFDEESTDDDDDDDDETPEERAKRKDFESKRKAHYNEYHAVKLAKKLLAEELSDEDSDEHKMEVDKKGQTNSAPRGHSITPGTTAKKCSNMENND